jgi:hypothetical protein
MPGFNLSRVKLPQAFLFRDPVADGYRRIQVPPDRLLARVRIEEIAEHLDG